MIVASVGEPCLHDDLTHSHWFAGQDFVDVGALRSLLKAEPIHWTLVSTSEHDPLGPGLLWLVRVAGGYQRPFGSYQAVDPFSLRLVNDLIPIRDQVPWVDLALLDMVLFTDADCRRQGRQI